MHDLLPDYDRPIRTEYKLLAQLRVNEPYTSLTEAAKRLGFSSAAVYQWAKRPDYQRYENYLISKRLDNEAPPEVRQTVQENFSEYAQYMQERLLAILDTSGNERLQAEIARDWLDRAGHAAVRKQESRNTVLVLTPEAAAALRQRAQEAFGDSVPERTELSA